MRMKISKVAMHEDDEQENKYLGIIELLLAAGYFRARIKGLSAFDKVVGGMTWCIETCNFDIDVDLLFQENLNIRHKIALTEKIVAVLPIMKCPHSLEPHQIQGLDFIHIYPVVQWLVKRAIETREETGDFIRNFSVLQFQKNYCIPSEKTTLYLLEKMKISYKELKETYKPLRLYKHHAPHDIMQEEIKVQTTLLEYGKKLVGSGEFIEAGNLQGHNYEVCISSFSMDEDLTVVNEEDKLTVSSVGSIVGLQSGEIQKIASEFAEKKAELSAEKMGGRNIGEVEYHRRTMASLSHQFSEKEQMLQKCVDRHANLKTRCEESEQLLKELQRTFIEVTRETQALEDVETVKNKSPLEKLRSLVAMNENLKKQEQEFRTYCKEEMIRLKSSVHVLAISSEESCSEDDERRQYIEKQYIAAREKQQKIRVLLAKKNREIAILQRKIDEVPSRAELSQYQKRFIELYNQVAAKHKETKQFYTLYNTLEDTRMYLIKEVDLLNSIQDNFAEAMSSSGTKEQFLAQLEQIVEKLLQNKQKLERRKIDEKKGRDRLNDQLLDLIEKQRLYFKTVKEFKEECRKNELLLDKLKGT